MINDEIIYYKAKNSTNSNIVSEVSMPRPKLALWANIRFLTL